jgi:hypothetical protein
LQEPATYGELASVDGRGQVVQLGEDDLNQVVDLIVSLMMKELQQETPQPILSAVVDGLEIGLVAAGLVEG